MKVSGNVFKCVADVQGAGIPHLRDAKNDVMRHTVTKLSHHTASGFTLAIRSQCQHEVLEQTTIQGFHEWTRRVP